MSGNSAFDIWIEKYGIEEALIRKENQIKKMLETTERNKRSLWMRHAYLYKRTNKLLRRQELDRTHLKNCFIDTLTTSNCYMTSRVVEFQKINFLQWR